LGHQTMVLLLYAALASGACGGIHRAPVSDRALLDQLGFLQAGSVTQSTIEARLGPPAHVYANDGIAAYHLFERDGRLTTFSSELDDRRYTLMLQYGSDGVLLRRSLVPAL